MLNRTCLFSIWLLTVALQATYGEDSVSGLLQAPNALEAPEPPEPPEAPFVHGHSTPDAGCPCTSPTCRACCRRRYGSRLHQRRAEFMSRQQAILWGYPELFNERPFGSFARSTFYAQIEKGMEKQLTLYAFDFEGDDLSYRGLYQTGKIARKLQTIAAPVTIESSDDEQLDERRREAVVNAFHQFGVPIEYSQVRVKWLLRPGLAGEEARAIYDNQLKQTVNSGGAFAGSAGTGVSGGVAPTPIQ